jgi:hypothetical protein
MRCTEDTLHARCHLIRLTGFEALHPPQEFCAALQKAVGIPPTSLAPAVRVDSIEYLLHRGPEERLILFRVHCVGSLGSDARKYAVFAHVDYGFEDKVLLDNLCVC